MEEPKIRLQILKKEENKRVEKILLEIVVQRLLELCP